MYNSLLYFYQDCIWYMKFLKSLFLSISLCISLSTPAFSEINSETKVKIQQLMKETLGLENIDLSQVDGDQSNIYRISYENRTFLHEIHVFGALLSGLKMIIPDNSSIEFYPQSNGKVISKLSLNFQDYLDFVNGKITEDELSKKLEFSLNPQYQLQEKYNPLMFHTDLVAGAAYILDPNNGPSLLFSPYINTYLDNGFIFNTRYRVPVYNVVNGFDYSKNIGLVPPGFGYTNIDYSSPVLTLPMFATLRLGHIYENTNNLLLSTDIQYMLMDGLFNINLASGFNYNVNNGLNDFSITPYAQYYLGKLDLVFEAGAGKFLGGEYGGWGRLTRQFDNVDIGFSLFRGFGAPQSGFRLNIEFNLAIGPEHSIHAAPIRLTYPRFFSGNLVAGQISGSIQPRYKVEDFVKRLYPEYIKTHLYYWLGY